MIVNGVGPQKGVKCVFCIGKPGITQDDGILLSTETNRLRWQPHLSAKVGSSRSQEKQEEELSTVLTLMNTSAKL